jgi:dolichyl-diphosphooligosaccharide--protein glycosyltransferase
MKLRHKKAAEPEIEAGHKAEHTRASERTSDDGQDDDMAVDFSGMKSFFKSIDMDKVVLAAFLIFCILLVFIIRMLPLSLQVTDDWASSTLQQNIRAQVSSQVDQQYPALPPSNRDALIQQRVDQIITQQQAQYDAAQAQLSQQFKSHLRYTGEDGKEHTYLGDLDSYFWLRYTRNILRHGSACDAVADGNCIDTYTVAPQGAMMSSNPSFHIFAIYGLYKFITIFNPQFPLPATSYLVPVIVGMLGVIPAFFIGRRLAGNVGGFFAAILISIHPLLLSRSLGSDNDIWNVVLPLFVLWMVIEALEAKSTKGRVIYSVLAAAFVGLHAATWDAYWFIYLIILFGLVANLIFRIGVSVFREHEHRPWKDRKVLGAALITGAFYVASYIFVLIGNPSSDYFHLPLNIFSASAGLDRAVIPDYWPNVLTTVAELNKSNLGEAIGSMYGRLFFFLALAGLLLMLLPRHRWKLKHYALFIAGSIISIYLINDLSVSKLVALGLLSLPIAIILITYLFEDENVDTAPALIILVWFLASIYATYSGVRFILLMIPAFGIAFAVTAGRIYEWLSAYGAREIKWHRYITNVIVFAILALILIQPIRAGRDTARNYIPSIDDAWWDSLTKINKESAPDAIINSWWDFGHWFKYVADRRVTADGTSQGTHIPRWLGLSLVTPDEQESVGTLRMLDCGSDTALGNTSIGAYSAVFSKVNDSIAAQQIIYDIVKLDRPQAQAYLAKRGFTQAEQDEILKRSHCNPPEDYFITSGDMVGKAGVWAHFGLWNFTRAYVAQHSRNLPHDEAVADLQRKFNMSSEEAEKLYYDAKALSSESEINQFVSPWPGYITSSWVDCKLAANNTAMVCPLGIGFGQQGGTVMAFDAFTYNMTNPNASRLVYGFYQNNQRVGTNGDGTPAALYMAYDDGMRSITFQNPTSSGIAVLIDVPNHRLLMADPLLINSTFTQLFYLDGRYSTHFEKFDDQTSFTGSRVIVWKVNWNGTAKQPKAAQTTVFVSPKQ